MDMIDKKEHQDLGIVHVGYSRVDPLLWLPLSYKALQVGIDAVGGLLLTYIWYSKSNNFVGSVNRKWIDL